MQGIHRWATATFILCFLVIIAGGVVRTTQSGMGCPDWPKCFGRWIPPTNASQLPADFEKYLKKQDIDHSFNAWHTWIEYINRLAGALLGLFAVIQLVLVFPRRKINPRAWRTALAFLVVVVLTGLFGALVVKYNLAHLSISVHLVFAILLLQIQLALWLITKQNPALLALTARQKGWLWFFLFALLMQVTLGTLVRMHVDDVSKALAYQERDTWLDEETLAFLVHRSFSWLVFFIAIAMAWMHRGMPTGSRNQFFALAFTITMSMVTGITLYVADMPAAAQPLHLLLASIAITQTVALILQSNRRAIKAG